MVTVESVHLVVIGNVASLRVHFRKLEKTVIIRKSRQLKPK